MVRLLSGAVLLLGVIAALWFLQPIYLLGIAVLVALLAFREYLDIAARAGAHVSRPAGGIAVAIVCVAVAIPGMPIDVALQVPRLDCRRSRCRPRRKRSQSAAPCSRRRSRFLRRSTLDYRSGCSRPHVGRSAGKPLCC